MNPAALVFLDDPLARKLAVAWATGPTGIEEWLSAAGIATVNKRRAVQVCECLKANGICTSDGVDDLAMTYITAVATKGMKIGKGKP